MTYITVVPEACFKIGNVDEGTCIHSWLREVMDTYVMFTAQCGQDDGSGRCALCWKQAADADGNLVLTYTCDDIDCMGAKKSRGKLKGADQGCALQYSMDGVEFSDVTPEEPAPDVNCYFRCLCCEQAKGKAKGKPKASRKAKAKSRPKSKPKKKR